MTQTTTKAHRKVTTDQQLIVRNLQIGEKLALKIWGTEGTFYVDRNNRIVRTRPEILEGVVFEGMFGDYDWTEDREPKQPRFAYRNADEIGISSVLICDYEIDKREGATIVAEVSNDTFLFGGRQYSIWDDRFQHANQLLRRHGR